MNAHIFKSTLAACGIYVVWAVAANYADAQVRRVIPPRAIPVPVQPVPVVPDPAQVPQPPQAPPENTTLPAPVITGQTAPNSGERVEAVAPQRETGRLLRGSQLIGMTIWGRDNERLGIVKDFIVDNQGGCPSLFFAMAPQIAGFGGDYVIVPFDAFQIGFDQQQRRDYFRLGIAVDNLRRAPHVQIDRWNGLNDRQFFTDARQFYQRVERTAARPDLDTRRDGRDGRGAERQDMRQPAEGPRETPALPRQPVPAPSGTNPGGEHQPGASREPQPTPAPPTAAPATPSPRPESGPSKRESEHGK